MRSIFHWMMNVIIHPFAVTIVALTLFIGVTLKDSTAHAEFDSLLHAPSAPVEGPLNFPYFSADDLPCNECPELQTSDFDDADDDDDEDSLEHDEDARHSIHALGWPSLAAKFDQFSVILPGRLPGGPNTPPPRL